MHKIEIRQEVVDDYPKVHQVVKEAFENAMYSDKDEHHLVDRLRKSECFVPELSLVAEMDGELVGHILFTELLIGDTTALGLAPVSVSVNHQGKGIGGKLIERGHEIAKRLGYKAIVLLGHADYYPRFGYKKAVDYGIISPFDVADENFMVVELSPGSLEGVSGLVTYAPAFFQG